MFEDALTETDAKKKARNRWITMPLSVILHCLIIAAFVIGPYLTADMNRPPVQVIDVFMAAAAPPPPPPPPPAKKSKEKAKKDEESKKDLEQKPIVTGRLVAPIEIPDEIPEENIGDLGVDFGVDGGVEGGVEGGVVGGVLGAPGASDGSSTGALQIAQVQQPRLIRRVEPSYPQVALKARIQGLVMISAVTDVYGKVIDAKVVSGHPLLREAARNAVLQWIYEPYILNGVPRAVKFSVQVNFNLQNQ